MREIQSFDDLEFSAYNMNANFTCNTIYARQLLLQFVSCVPYLKKEKQKGTILKNFQQGIMKSKFPLTASRMVRRVFMPCSVT